MTARPLLTFPDPRLKRKAAPVSAFDEALAALAADITDTMAAASAIGLTAPHIDVPLRVVVTRLESEEAPRIFVNPQVIWADAESASFEEGSVSMKGMREAIARPARIRLAWQDLKGAAHEEEIGGFLATVMQHEIDQLDGIFWIERLSRLKRERLVKRFQKERRIPL